MDRSEARASQHLRATRADGDFARRAVLHAGCGKPGEPEADALAGRADEQYTRTPFYGVRREESRKLFFVLQ
jgi:hypothetical protein